MTKYIVAIAALVALAVPTAAMASVAVDANGVGFVGKGDVQSALGWNDGTSTRTSPASSSPPRTQVS